MNGLGFTDSTEEARNIRDAWAGHIGRSTVALVPVEGAKLGSGVLVSWREARYIATARHVVEYLGRDEIFVIPRSKEPLKIYARDELSQHMREDRPVGRVRIIVREALSSTDRLDVALLRIDKLLDDLHWMNFYPLERANSAQQPHGLVMVYGYEWDLTQVQRITGEVRVVPRNALGRLLDKGPERYDKTDQLLISYDADEMSPKGMSGGGIWTLPSLEKPLFNPNDVILAGILVGHFRKSRGKPLTATRIESVKHLLR